MITANVAGYSAGGSNHYRPPADYYHNHYRESAYGHSRLNLHQDESEDENGCSGNHLRVPGYHGGGGGGSVAGSVAGSSDHRVDMSRSASQFEFKPGPGGGAGDDDEPFVAADCKTWAYLLCVGLIVVGAIVLIIMAAMGKFTGR